jgi:hypothetical protein
MINGLGANVFVANHDTERVGSFHAIGFGASRLLQNDLSLRFDSPSNTYILAMILSL